jgi:hypothetical protein
MYILKIKGKAKIPDYVQIRDKDFTLVAYFRADKVNEKIKQLNNLNIDGDKLSLIIKNIEYGKIMKLYDI